MDWIKDLILGFWDDIKLFEIVDAYEGGVHLRRGQYLRTLLPGLWWKIPFVDKFIVVPTCITTMRLPSQMLVTSDGVQVVVGTVIKYEIKDVRPFILDIWDRADVLGDVSMGAVKQVINSTPYSYLVTPEVNTEKQILDRIRLEVNQYGFKMHKVTFTELAKTKSIRLISSEATVSSVDN